MTVAEIIRVVASHHMVQPSKLRGPDRHRDLSTARMIVALLSKRLTTASYPEIGRALGGRHHTTIMYERAKAERLLVQDAFRAVVDEIAARLNEETPCAASSTGS